VVTANRGWEGAAADAAASLAAHVIAEAVQLDERCCRLAGDDLVLGMVLLDIEQTALRQMHREMQTGLLAMVNRVPPPPARQRRWRWLGRLPKRRPTRRRRTSPVVQELVVPDVPETPEPDEPPNESEGD
jgi:hypothetical protein